jgi:hypothetical protein
MMRETLRTILLLFVLITDNAGATNLKKNKKNLKKGLTHIAFCLYDQV